MMYRHFLLGCIAVLLFACKRETTCQLSMYSAIGQRENVERVKVVDWDNNLNLVIYLREYSFNNKMSIPFMNVYSIQISMASCDYDSLRIQYVANDADTGLVTYGLNLNSIQTARIDSRQLYIFKYLMDSASDNQLAGLQLSFEQIAKNNDAFSKYGNYLDLLTVGMANDSMRKNTGWINNCFYELLSHPENPSLDWGMDKIHKRMMELAGVPIKRSGCLDNQ